ncbi:MAG: hypothetical protein HYT80_08560 [Euryarchaeota archaeon]|nr:hypothetical protein [Euryarchaeota archaeon]
MVRGVAVLVLSLIFLVPSVGAQYKPEQIHVTLAGTPQEGSMQPPEAGHFAFQWTVAQPYLAQHRPQIKIKINDRPEQMVPASVVGVPRDYSPPTATDELEALPVYGALVRVPLRANVTYQVGEPTAGFSEPINIQGLGAPNEPARIVAFAGVGFTGYSRLGVRTPGVDAPAERTVQLALNLTPDAVLLAGNLAGSSSSKPWDGFLRLMQPLQSQVPTVPVPGELDAPDNTHQLRERYVLPNVDDQTPSAQGEEVELTYHGFSVGPVYVIGLDSTRVCEPATPTGNALTVAPCANGVPNRVQLDWLKGVLEDANEDLKAAWIVVYLNKGPYVYGDDGDDLAVRQLWAPVFESFGVDLVIHSSEAFYQRTFPLRNGLPVASTLSNYTAGSSPVYVMSGAAGSSPAPPYDRPQPGWVALTRQNRTLLQLDATNETLTVTAMVTDTGEVIDVFSIEKSAAFAKPSLPVAGAQAPAPGPVLLVGLILAAVVWLRRRGGA